MTAFLGLGLITLSLCVPYRPTGWPIVAFWLGAGLVFGSVIWG